MTPDGLYKISLAMIGVGLAAICAVLIALVVVHLLRAAFGVGDGTPWTR